MDAEFKTQLDKWNIEAVRFVRKDLSEKWQEELNNVTLAVVGGLMDRPDGRRWLFNQLEICRVNTSPIVPGKPDMTSFLCGVQAYGHELLSQVMKASPEKYHIMLQEEYARKLALRNADEDHHS